MSFSLITVAILAVAAMYFTMNAEGIKQLAALKESINIQNKKNVHRENAQEAMNKMIDDAAARNNAGAQNLVDQSADQTQEMLKKSMVPMLNGKPLKDALPDVSGLNLK